MGFADRSSFQVVGLDWLLVVGLAVAATPPTGGPLDAAIGDASCTADTQCRTVPVHRQACGGPSAYVAWSERVARPDAIASAAQADDAAWSAAAGPPGRRMSTCGLAADPGAFCAIPARESAASALAGTCRLRPRGQGTDPRPDR